jgi:hypothetical protein
MYLSRFLVGATATLVFIFGWIYSVTGSFWASAAWTAIGAVVLQVGYFACVLVVIFRHADEAIDADRAAKRDDVFPVERDGIFF